MNPNTCKIEGLVVSILKVNSHSKYSNKAKIKIKAVKECGSSVSQPLQTEDIVTVSFAYTLHNTSTLFPKIRPALPGLRKGNLFVANVEEHQLPGGKIGYIIYDYSLK
jgi:hypothetical protein